MSASKLLPTSLVGSYAQPNWLLDRAKLASRFPPRTRAKELWRIDDEFLEEAQNDATILAIRDQERAGLDIITDGEMRRESYSNRFATALDGVDIDNPGTALDRSGHPNPVPRIVGPIRRKHPIEVEDVKFLRANTNRRIKITVPGPFTMTQQAENEHYEKESDLAMDYAVAVNEEVRDLFAAGADIVQLNDIRAGSKKIAYLFVNSNSIIHCEVGLFLVVLVFRLLCHGERSGYSDLDTPVRISP